MYLGSYQTLSMQYQRSRMVELLTTCLESDIDKPGDCIFPAVLEIKNIISAQARSWTSVPRSSLVRIARDPPVDPRLAWLFGV